MNLKVSIIIPCYNIEYYLPKCIDSILNQTFKDYELLLIDDGSTDKTLEVCEYYQKKDGRIKVFTHSNNGVSYTRNRGIELAKNELLAFIDGDDYIKPDYLEKLVNGYEEGTWTICGMINEKNGFTKENENYQLLLNHFSNYFIEKGDFLFLLKYYSYSSPCARIYSKKIIIENKIYFDLSISYQEDLIFNLAYSKYIDRVLCLDYFGYFYVAHVNSSSNQYHEKFDHIELLLKKLYPLINSNQDELIVKEFIFSSVMKKMSNILHPNNRNLQKKEEVLRLFKSSSYDYMYSYIEHSNVNFVLKIILKLKSSIFLCYYYKLRKSNYGL